MVAGEQAVVNELCKIREELSTMRMLSKAAEDRVIDVYFVTVPEEGGTRNFTTGTTKINFRTGEIINPDGSIDYLSRKLNSVQQKEFMHSISIYSSQDIKFRLNTSGQQTVYASFLFQLPYVTYFDLEITCTETTSINLFACTNPQATLGNFKVTTISTIQQESVSGDTTEDQTWDAVISLKNNMNRLRHQIVAITGEAWGTVSDSIQDLFNTTTGHDHDGTDSKKVDSGDVINTPSGNIVATEVQAAINELDGQDDTHAADTSTHGVSEVADAANYETGADVTDAANIASSIVGVAAKATPVDADTLPIIDSADASSLKEVLWSQIKATLKTYFDTLYDVAGGLTTHAADTSTHGVTGTILGTEDKDIASGIAGLDTNKLLEPVVHLVGLEEYINHLGATDNFTQTVTSGNGTATTDSTNHEMDLSCGTGAAGSARFTSKSTYVVGSKPIILNFLIQNIVNGSGGSRYTQFGLVSDFTSQAPSDRVAFVQKTNNAWDISTKLGGSESYTGISALTNGDLCTIIYISGKARFFVNGTLVGTNTSNLPTASIQFGCGIVDVVIGATNAREISVDMMSMKRYH